MVNAVQIGTVISDVLSTTEVNVEKLQKLNLNPYLNSFLVKKEHEAITEAIVTKIEEASENEANTNILKFYLHEISLIFNLENFDSYFKGVAN